jgi:hypothetical protein
MNAGHNRKDVKLPTQSWQYELQVWALKEERKSILLEFLSYLPPMLLLMFGLSTSMMHNGISRMEMAMSLIVSAVLAGIGVRTACKLRNVNDEISKVLLKALKKNSMTLEEDDGKEAE